jgi:hypothetical protein
MCGVWTCTTLAKGGRVKRYCLGNSYQKWNRPGTRFKVAKPDKQRHKSDYRLWWQSASSVRSPAFFFALLRRLRSLSRCLAFRISPFDRPGLFMSSSYTSDSLPPLKKTEVYQTLSNKMRRAILLFCSRERVSWHDTRIPVGLCSSWTLFCVLFMDCPPGPLPAIRIRDRKRTTWCKSHASDEWLH